MSQNSQENTCIRVSFSGDSKADVFLWIVQNLKNNFFTEHLRTTVSK